MDKEKITRCGACGSWQLDPRLYTKKEQDEAELIHCGCEAEAGEERHYVTRDMAIDACDPSLEGSEY